MGLTAAVLYDIAKEAGFEPLQLALNPVASDSAAWEPGVVIVSQYGCRVLGVFPSGEAENLLWLPPELESIDSATELKKSGSWKLGGERLWLSPEIELHFSDPNQPSGDNYAVPQSTDPGCWNGRGDTTNGLSLTNRGKAINHLSKSEFGFTIERSVTIDVPPESTRDVASIGYQVETKLMIEPGDRPDAVYGLWNVAMVPAGGTMLIPTHPQPELVDYFQTDIGAFCSQWPAHVAFPMTGSAFHKLGLIAGDVRGTMGYLRPLPNGQANLIVRQVSVDPQGVYCDYPGHDRNRRDVAFQFYNDDGMMGPYGEFECHAPAATAKTGFRASDHLRTWAFTGPEQRMREIAMELLDLSDLG
jgi:hypothetical protein